jgi:hypothetical protein
VQVLTKARVQRAKINVFDGGGADVRTGSLTTPALGLADRRYVDQLISAAQVFTDLKARSRNSAFWALGLERVIGEQVVPGPNLS